ncbi:hypothetical protein B0T20DRAFT_390839 [Sordaria brevicollis]|uniref:Uncharacterized protein n=1 Tax=Sordaria brevicollis TaxID=83679 RepID=A0AAE0PJ86_SORBR|nr:hypothetical protein B0T20DRAFT_390839 [Sordaria brevicollis]
MTDLECQLSHLKREAINDSNIIDIAVVGEDEDSVPRALFGSGQASGSGSGKLMRAHAFCGNRDPGTRAPFLHIDGLHVILRHDLMVFASCCVLYIFMIFVNNPSQA